MPPSPTMADYLTRHYAYQQFVALVVLLALMLAYWLVRLNGKSLYLRVPVRFIVLLALVVRLPLMWQSYWYDENFTSMVVRSSWPDFFAIIATDVHPPGYYFVVRLFVMVIGHHPFVMRLPALIAGLLLVWVVGRAYGRWAALLVALMPAFVYYSTEARYPMALALVLLLAFRAIRNERLWLAGVWLAVAATFHVNAWFYVAVMLLWFLPSRKILQALPPLVAVGAWLPFAYIQSRDVIDGFWLQQSIPVRFVVDMTITGRHVTWPTGLTIAVQVAVVVCLLAAAWHYRRYGGGLWLACMVGPPALQWLVGFAVAPIYLDRTLMFSALLLLLACGWYFTWYAHRAVAACMVVCLVAALPSITNADRSPADDIVSLCGDRTIYAGTTFSAIVASDYAERVILWRDGETTAQSMAYDVRNSLWLLTDFEWLPERNACLFTVVDSFTSQQQIDHIHRLAPEAQILEVNPYAYYVVDVR